MLSRRTTSRPRTSSPRRRCATGPRASTSASEVTAPMTTLSRGGTLLAALLGILLAAGCGLLDTETPNVIDPNTLNTPEAAEALRLGALADFAFVKDGDGTQTDDGLILVSGLLSDEFILSTTPPSEQEVDQRTTALI